MAPSRWIAAWGAGLALIASAGPSRASDSAAAQALFDAAKKLMAAQQYAEACPKFEESLRLDPALGTLLNLAVCLETEGKLASAWSAFLDLAAKAAATAQKARERIGRDRAAALAPRLPKIVVTAPHATPNVQITRDGIRVGPAQLGTEIPTDPGMHTFAASAVGMQPWFASVSVTEGRTSTIVVPELVPIVGEPAPEPVHPPPARPVLDRCFSIGHWRAESGRVAERWRRRRGRWSGNGLQSRVDVEAFASVGPMSEQGVC
jgi:hypothetical protein